MDHFRGSWFGSYRAMIGANDRLLRRPSNHQRNDRLRGHGVIISHRSKTTLPKIFKRFIGKA
jgi:hypothetical protein